MEIEPRMIIVSNGAGSTYIGYVTTFPTGMLEGGPILLKEARLLSVVTIPREHNGQMVLSQVTKPMAMPACSGPINMYIRPTMWFWPDEDANALIRLGALLKGAEQHEKDQRMAESGLITPGRGEG
jgi:hypothetical protein